jgi:peptidoglycan/xylan/chitin deacetylase (PgdA/CDA1 family)
VNAAIPILTYHQIDAAPARGAPFRSLYVSPKAFGQQMAFLAALGYRGLSMSALMPYLRGEKSGKVFGVTFDDGYLNNLTHALPVLLRHGFTATCYFVSRRLGNTNDWDADIGIAQTALMDAVQLRQWAAAGQEVGAHSLTHPRLNALASAEALAEIAGAKAELEALSGQAVAHFCYPFGAYSPAHVAMVKDAGYQSATTTERGRSRPTDDILQLPRVPVVRSTTRAALWLKLATAYEDRRRTNGGRLA